MTCKSTLHWRLDMYQAERSSHIHNKTYSQSELFELQPALAKAHNQGKVQVPRVYPIVSVVKGMTFILVELESVEALGLVSIAGRGAVVEGLDEGWDDTFVGTYFFVRTGKSDDGAIRLQSRMIEGPLEVKHHARTSCTTRS